MQVGRGLQRPVVRETGTGRSNLASPPLGGAFLYGGGVIAARQTVLRCLRDEGWLYQENPKEDPPPENVGVWSHPLNSENIFNIYSSAY